LKGLDAKPRISLVDDRDHHNVSDSSDFISVIHTPLPPTPVSHYSSSTFRNSNPPPKASTPLPPLPVDSSFYSPIKNNRISNGVEGGRNNFNCSTFRKTSKSSDSLLNSTHNSSFNNFDDSYNNKHRSNLSINNNNNTHKIQYSEANNFTNNTNNAKSHSSNPNILSPNTPINTHDQRPNNFPIKFPILTSPRTNSFTTPTSNNIPFNQPNIPFSRSFSTRLPPSTTPVHLPPTPATPQLYSKTLSQEFGGNTRSVLGTGGVPSPLCNGRVNPYGENNVVLRNHPDNL